MFIKFSVYNPLQEKEQIFELPHSYGIDDFVLLAKEELSKHTDDYLRSLSGQYEKYNIAEQIKNKSEWVEVLFSTLAKAKNDFSGSDNLEWRKYLEGRIEKSFDKHIMNNKNYYSWVSINFLHESIVYEFLNNFANAASDFDIDKDPLRELIINEISKIIEDKAQKNDISSVMESIPNEVPTTCYLIKQNSANAEENMIVFSDIQDSPIKSIIPNNGLKKLLELANISSDEFKKAISSNGFSLSQDEKWKEFQVEKNKNTPSCVSINQLISLINNIENGGIPVFTGRMFIYDLLKKDIDSSMIFSNGSIGIYSKEKGIESSIPVSGKVLVNEQSGNWMTKKMINELLSVENNQTRDLNQTEENEQLLCYKIKQNDGSYQNSYSIGI